MLPRMHAILTLTALFMSATYPDAAAPADAGSPAPALSEAERAHLAEYDWAARVGKDQLAVWVDVATQRFVLLRGTQVVWVTTCATGAAGTGQRINSLQTPLGWHEVGRKIGGDAPWGQVFRGRVPTGEIWQPGMDTTEDLVLTRILWLDGLEPGFNQGTNAEGVVVDSRRRYIYIHGTNGEADLGTPSSHGCVRLSNDDVIEAYARIPEGTLVLISERRLERGESQEEDDDEDDAEVRRD